MEELHRIHKDVPFGYWVDGVMPLSRWLMRMWAAHKADQRPARMRPALDRR
jgi:hypothetical protein